MTSPVLHRILAPSSVAVIGASQDPTKRGHQAVRALKNSRFEGGVFPVHPSGGELLGLRVYPSVSELPEVPDLALISLAAGRVPSAVAECGQVGIGGAVVLAVGFRESGADGGALESELVATARAYGMRIIGPNTSGILNPHIGLNLVGVESVTPGSLAILSQSGNIGLDLMTAMAASGLGLSLYVGVGNESDIAFHEYLEYLEADRNTRGVLTYVEGFQDARSFLEVAGRVNRTKPVIVLKGGRSQKGIEAALSHTGAVAGSYDAFKALAAQRGVVVVERSDEFLGIGKTLTHQPPIAPGHGIGVIADGGGHATLAVDLLAERGIELASFGQDSQGRMAELLGPAAATGNPVDLAGGADRRLETFASVMETVVAEPDVGGILLTGLFGGYALRFDSSLEASEAVVAGRLAEQSRKAGIPLVVHTVYAARTNPALDALRAAGVPVLASLDTAIGCIEAVVARGRFLEREFAAPVPPKAIDTPEAPQVLTARKEGRRVLTEWEIRPILERHGIPLVDAEFCRTAEEAADVAARSPEPVVLKLLSSSILHRTEAGGIELGVQGAREASDGFDRIRLAADRFAASANIESCFQGVLVSPLLGRPTAELLVACRHDPHYGPILVVGAGGELVETTRDRAIRGLPLQSGDFRDMVDALRIAPLLRGYRGRDGADMASVERLCLGLGDALAAHPSIYEIELNPVFVYPSNSLAVDALALLSDF